MGRVVALSLVRFTLPLCLPKLAGCQGAETTRIGFEEMLRPSSNWNSLRGSISIPSPASFPEAMGWSQNVVVRRLLQAFVPPYDFGGGFFNRARFSKDGFSAIILAYPNLGCFGGGTRRRLIFGWQRSWRPSTQSFPPRPFWFAGSAGSLAVSMGAGTARNQKVTEFVVAPAKIAP